MAKSNERDIGKFLEECRELLENNFFLWRRQENKETRIALGLTNADIKNIVRNLTVGDYSSGPEGDYNSTDLIWVFGVDIESREVYIKLLISEFNDPGERIKTLHCLSFHFAERGLNYPYK